MSAPPLACTVRGCGLFLERQDRMFACARAHAYDVARSGYVNLLQPQDRRSLEAGDSREAVEARARLARRGIGRGILHAVIAKAASLPLPAPAAVVDLGSGTGEALARLAALHPIEGIGIDLSVPAVDHAVRRFPHMTWVVANADRHLPLLDRSVDLVLSIHGRRNPAECARVLTRAGLLLLAVPAHGDLAEMRQLVLGHAAERDRVAPLLAEHDRWFTPVERWSFRERTQLDRSAIEDLLRGTYRGARFSAAPRLQAVQALDVTFASEAVAMRPR